MGRVWGAWYFLLMEYLFLHLLWLVPNISEGSLLLLHAILLKKMSYLIYQESPVTLLSPFNRRFIGTCTLIVCSANIPLPWEKSAPFFLGICFGIGMVCGRRSWTFFVMHSGRWSPRILFWSYENLLFGAGLVVAGFLFYFGICSLLKSIWRCPWVCLHDHERPQD